MKLTMKSRKSHRRSTSLRVSPVTSEVQLLEGKAMMSGVSDYPATDQEALTTLLEQESRELVVRDGRIEYGNEPIRLIGYGDYGMLSESDFKHEQFMGRIGGSGANMVRVWLQYQWTGQDGLSPFHRNASTGKYNLTKLNDAYFERLEEFLAAAESRGIVVQLTLFDIITLKNDPPKRWSGSPFNTQNQVPDAQYPLEGSDHIDRLTSFNTHRALWRDALQPLVHRTVEVTRQHGNVILEIMNEPEEPDTRGETETTDFHRKAIRAIRSADRRVPIAVNGHRDGRLLEFAKDNRQVDIVAVHARSRDKDKATSPERDAELAAVAETVRQSSKPVIISNDGDLTQVNPDRKNQQSSDEREYEDETRVELLQDMMEEAFSSGQYGKAHFEVLDKGLNGDTWLSRDYEISHKAVDTEILGMLRRSDDVNHRPNARNDRFRTMQDASKRLNVVHKKNARRNDSDRDGQTVRVTGVLETSACGGTVELLGRKAGRPQFRYTPPSGFSGTDYFWYSLSDRRGGRDVARVTIQVRAPERLSTGVNQQSSLRVGQLNDGLGERILSVSQPASGAVVAASNVLQYTPAHGFVGVDEFSYAIDDGQGELVHIPVAVEVAPVALESGVLRVVGDDSNDQITVSGQSELEVNVGGSIYRFARSAVSEMEVHSGGGNDYVSNRTDVPMTAHAGSGDDRIEGGHSADRLFGEDGVDQLFGGAGMDWLDGGSGNDHVHGGSGNDQLFGGSGNDTLEGRDGDDLLHGGEGNDVLYGNNGHDVMYGQSGNDALFGEGGNDTMRGGRGDDFIRGDEGDDHLDGGRGNDHLQGKDGADKVDGGDGNDFLEGGAGNDSVHGGSGVDSLYGNGGNDLLRGGSHTDYMFGGRGDDELYGEAGHDYMDGGQGNDRLDGHTDRWWSRRIRRFRGWIWG